MSVVGLCVVFIPGWVGARKVAEPIGSCVPVCPCARARAA